MNNYHYKKNHNKKIRKRKLQVRRNIFILVMSIAAAVVCASFMASFSAQARGNYNAPECKYYKSIEISKGDTLWSIAEEHIDKSRYKNVSEYINEVKAMNSIASDNIVSGSHIIIPYYAADP